MVSKISDYSPDRHGMDYINQRSAALYPASGDSADWVHDVLNVTDSYTFELRDTGTYGFELPADQVQLASSICCDSC